MMVLCSVHAVRWAFSLFPCGASSEDDVEEEEEEDERMAHNGQALVDQLDKRIKAIQREMQEKRRSQVLPPPHPSPTHQNSAHRLSSSRMAGAAQATADG